MYEEEREIATEAVVEAEAPVQEQHPKEDRAAHHLYNMRKKLEAEADAREKAERRAADLERIIQEKQFIASALPHQEEEDISIDNEEYVQAKHVKTSNSKLRRQLEEQNKKLESMAKMMSYLEAKSDTATLKDFDDVVSTDNMKMLATLYPDDYESVMANPNLRARSRTAYNMIKNYNIHNDRPASGYPPENTRKIDDRIASNKSRPQAASVAAPKTPPTPLSEFGDERRIMSESDYARVRAEMHRKKVLYGLESPE